MQLADVLIRNLDRDGRDSAPLSRLHTGTERIVRISEASQSSQISISAQRLIVYAISPSEFRTLRVHEHYDSRR